MTMHSSDQIRKSFLLLTLSAFLFACGETPSEIPQTTLTSMHITQQDECHLCGMLIKGFPGPKGVIQTDLEKPLKKFCSSNDLFAYLLQPENAPLKKQAYVHDMSKADWHTPNDAAFVQVEEAWYVIGHKLKGAMGPTIASFASQQGAEQFLAGHQGRVIRFVDINLELLNALSQEMHTMDHMHHH